MDPTHDRGWPSTEASSRGGDLLGHLGHTGLDGVEPRCQEPDAVGVDETDKGTGGDRAGETQADALEHVVERNQAEHDTHRHDRSRDGIADSGEPRREAGRSARDESRPVGDEDRGEHAHDGGEQCELQGVAEELEEAFGVRGAPRPGDLLECPRHELESRGQEREEQHDAADGKGGPRSRPLEATGPEPGRSTGGLTEAGPAAHDALEPDDHQRNHQHEGRELRCGVTIEGAAPDAEDADRHGVNAEILDGCEVGDRLHHHDGHASGECRSKHRDHDTTRCLERSGAEGSRNVVGRPGLVGERSASQQEDVRVEHEREDHDRATHRLDLGEPCVTTKPVAPLVLYRTGETEDRHGHESEHVRRHRKWCDQQPTKGFRSREAVGADKPGETAAEKKGAEAHPDQEHCGVDKLAGQARVPLLTPDLGLGIQDADCKEADRDDDQRSEHERATGPASAAGPVSGGRLDPVATRLGHGR